MIPAVDVAGGRLVRMTTGAAEPVDAFGGDPVAAADAFAAAGAGRIHVVDVDQALTGEPANLPVLRSIVALGVAVQASGGVTSEPLVERLLAAGADRVVLGSGAFPDRAATERLIGRFGERLCVGIEADGQMIRPRGGGAELAMWDTLVWLTTLDVRRYVLTEVRRVGGLEGPDLDGIWALATHARRPVIASGGIRSVQDLRAIAGLGGTVEGAIVGRALQESLDLAEALAVGS